MIIISDNRTTPLSFISNKLKPWKPQAHLIEWSSEMSIVLLRELVQGIRDGKRSNSAFKMEVWNSVAEAVSVASGNGMLYTGEKCQGKLQGLKRKWKVWMRLITISGFELDPITSAVTAPDNVWNTEIKKQPVIQESRDKPMSNIIELQEILEGFQVTGGRAIYPVPGFTNQLHSSVIETGSQDEHVIDSDNIALRESGHPAKDGRWIQLFPIPF